MRTLLVYAGFYALLPLLAIEVECFDDGSSFYVRNTPAIYTIVRNLLVYKVASAHVPIRPLLFHICFVNVGYTCSTGA